MLIKDTTEEQFDELVDVNFKGVFFLTQKLIPLIVDGGRVINISSGLARFCLSLCCCVRCSLSPQRGKA